MRWDLMLLPGVKWSISYNWQRDVLLTMEGDGHGRMDTDGRTDAHTHTHTFLKRKGSKTSIFEISVTISPNYSTSLISLLKNNKTIILLWNRSLNL